MITDAFCKFKAKLDGKNKMHTSQCNWLRFKAMLKCIKINVLLL